ncbi:MAG: hypothetical protein PVF80_15385, partial [Gammaproteobacteria bacterium]
MAADNRSQAAAQDHVARGIAALVLATLLFATQDAITKHLTASVPVLQLMFVRYCFFALFAMLYATRRKSLMTAFRSRRTGLQL